MSKKIPVIIDFEASGFGAGSYPIEVGYADERGGTWCSLIKPQEDWRHWDASAAGIHHISRDTLIQHGKSCALVATQLNGLLRGQIIYTDGWAHDYVWMARLFDAANTWPQFRLEDLRCILSPEQQDNWHVIKAAVQRELATARHRASLDARVLQLTWLRTRADGMATTFTTPHP
jgi:hypothetical protein